jgi:hypothetical protein
MSLELIYPRNNTKISNPEINFRWNTNRTNKRCNLIIFRLSKRPLRWEKIYSNYFVRNSYKKFLQPDNVYHCILISNANPRLILKFKMPNINNGLLTPKLHPQFTNLVHVSATFYVKKRTDYLEKYLNIKKDQLLKPHEHLGPTIPLLFYFLDRYQRWEKDPDSIKLTTIEQNFTQTMHNAPPEFRSIKRIEKLVNTYNNEKFTNLKEKLFEPIFTKFPQDVDAENWINEAIDSLFSETWLAQLKETGHNKKTMDIEFKQQLLIVNNIPLNSDLRIPIKPELVGSASDKLNIRKEYYLKIIPHNNNVALVPLQLIKDDDKYYLYNSATDLGSYDAAVFKAELWEKDPNNPDIGDRLWGYRGRVQIKGGIPLILGIEPNSVPEISSQEIKITVRDGGIGKKIILKNGSQVFDIPTDENRSIVRVDQTLHYQVYTFKLTDCSNTISPNTYDLTFQNIDRKDSINSLIFSVKGWKYRAWIKEIKCIDESNPEWFGDDSVSFQTFINTKNFLQEPTSSKTYDGFHDGVRLARFSKHENYIYPYALRPNGQRLIEDFMSINIALYEHDDLEWLDWLINAVVKLVQSFLAHLIDAFTYGLGGYIIEAALEVSGLNDMREQAVDSMVSGWEVELLHQGQTTLIPGVDDTYQWSLEMATSESKYKVTFKADRAL